MNYVKISVNLRNKKNKTLMVIKIQKSSVCKGCHHKRKEVLKTTFLPL